jgi:hypothetical protein
MRLSYFNGDNIIDLSLYGLAVFYLFWSKGCKGDPEVPFHDRNILSRFRYTTMTVLVLESPDWFIPRNVLLA